MLILLPAQILVAQVAVVLVQQALQTLILVEQRVEQGHLLQFLVLVLFMLEVAVVVLVILPVLAVLEAQALVALVDVMA